MNEILQFMESNHFSALKVWIKPAIAKSLLQNNKSNRDIVRSKVTGFTADMRNDDWTYTTQTMTITTSGALVDGQHRAEGIVASGKTLPFLLAVVTPSAADKMREKIDHNLTPRSGVHIFQIHAKQNGLMNYSKAHIEVLSAMSGLIYKRKATLADRLAVEAVFGQDIKDMFESCSTAKKNRTSSSVRCALVVRLHEAIGHERQHVLDQWRNLVLFSPRVAGETDVDKRVRRLIETLDNYQQAVKRGGSIPIDTDLATISWQGWDQTKRHSNRKIVQHPNPVTTTREAYETELEKFNEIFIEMQTVARRAMMMEISHPVAPNAKPVTDDIWSDSNTDPFLQL